MIADIAAVGGEIVKSKTIKTFHATDDYSHRVHSMQKIKPVPNLL